MLQDRFEVRGVYSSVAKMADSVAQEFGCERFDGYRAMLQAR